MPLWNNRLSEGLSRSTTPPVMQSLIAGQLKEICTKVTQSTVGQVTEGRLVLENLLREIQVELEIDPADIGRVPATGPVVIVSNRPFGILDGAILGAALLRIRPDVKILANSLLASIPEFQPHCIFVETAARKGLSRKGSAKRKEAPLKGIKRAVSHLRNGGLLIVFPAGEVSQWQFRYAGISDREWGETAVRLTRNSQATVVPALCMGRNSVPFHLLGMIHPALGTPRLSHELLNKAGKHVQVRLGAPIAPEKFNSIADNALATRYLRWRTYLLGSRSAESETQPLPLAKLPVLLKKKPEPVAPPVAAAVIAREIESLGSGCKLDENKEFCIFAAQAEQIPESLTEIGRLREITFREVGEGTGKELDLDRFDPYYTHLVLWSKVKKEIAGAYRVMSTQDVLSRKGIQGLYTSTLFHYSPKFFEKIGPAIELGRSFIRSEYQKQYAPLLMLWKGIARYAVLHSRTPILFGAVSISGSYHRISRELIVRFFEGRDAGGANGDVSLSELVRPRRPFRPRLLRGWELSGLNRLFGLDDLSASISEIEADGKGVPVLLKQYLKVGGTVLTFNVDKNFSNVLDGLILVDLRKADPTRLQTYIDKDKLSAFLQDFASRRQVDSMSEKGV